MLADLLFALRRGVDQLTYWCHTYLPFSRWRAVTEEVVDVARQEAARYGLTDAEVDRRRAYQVARMIVADRHGDHLVDLVPNAYGVYAPTSCAKSHQGKKKFEPRLSRRDSFRRHPQVLAFLLTPPALSRQGLGGSAPGTVCGVPLDEAAPPPAAVADLLRQQLGGGGGTTVDAYARVVATLAAGPPQEEETAEAA